MKHGMKIFRRFKKAEEPKPEVKVQSTTGVYFIHDLRWKNKAITKALGRNGTMMCKGINLLPYNKLREDVRFPHSNKFLEISPINSKGNVGRCYIQIPKEMIPEIIVQLQNYYNSVS